MRTSFLMNVLRNVEIIINNSFIFSFNDGIEALALTNIRINKLKGSIDLTYTELDNVMG